jgi:opacity protein-like surface antigen
LLAAAVSAQTQPQVRVKDPAAVIRMAPEAGARVILDSLTPGTVYPVQRRMGDWYEIKFASPSGVLLTGYIHRLHVEEVLSEAASAPRESGSEKERAFVSPLRSGLELGLTGGMGFNRFRGNTTDYSTGWGPVYDLSGVGEAGTLYFTLGNPTTLAVSGAYFFSPGLGLRFQIDPSLKQSFEEGFSNYSITWITEGADSVSSQRTWPLSGSFSITPISFNAIARVALGSVVTAFLTAGPTVFTGTFTADSSIGYGRAWFDTARNIDFFTIPIKLEKTVTGFGFNVGAGLEVWAARSIAILLEGAYFGGPSTTEKWAVQAGPYTSNFTAGITWANTALPGQLADYLTPLTVKFSFFKIVAGVKIHL